MNRPFSTWYLLAASLILLVGTTTAPAGEKLPKGAIRRLGTAAFRQGSAVVAMAVYPDGKRVATMGLSGVHLWDVATGERIAFAKLPSPPRKKRNPPLLPSVRGRTTSLAASPDGASLLLFRNGSVFRLDPALKEEPVCISDDTGLIRLRAVQYGKDAGTLFGLTDKGALAQWTSAKPRWSQLPISDMGEKAVLRAAGSLAAVSSSLGVVRIWDDEKKQELDPVSVKPECYNLAISKDGSTLAAASRPSSGKLQVQVWNLHTATKHATFFTDYFFRDFRLDFDGGSLLSCDDVSGEMEIWDTKTGKVRRTIKLSGEIPKSIDFSPNGRQFFVATEQGVLAGFDAASGARLDDPKLPTGAIAAIHYLPNETLLFASQDGRVHQTPLERADLSFWDLSVRRFAGFALTPDSRTAALCDLNGQLRIWDVASKKEKRIMEDKQVIAGYFAVGVSDDGKKAAVAEGGPRIAVFDTTQGKVLRVLPRDRDVIMDKVAFLPDGKLLTRDSRHLSLYDIDKNERIYHAELPSAFYKHNGFTPVSRRQVGCLRIRCGDGGHHKPNRPGYLGCRKGEDRRADQPHQRRDHLHRQRPRLEVVRARHCDRRRAALERRAAEVACDLHRGASRGGRVPRRGA